MNCRSVVESGDLIIVFHDIFFFFFWIYYLLGKLPNIDPCISITYFQKAEVTQIYILEPILQLDVLSNKTTTTKNMFQMEQCDGFHI